LESENKSGATRRVQSVEQREACSRVARTRVQSCWGHCGTGACACVVPIYGPQTLAGNAGGGYRAQRQNHRPKPPVSLACTALLGPSVHADAGVAVARLAISVTVVVLHRVCRGVAEEWFALRFLCDIRQNLHRCRRFGRLILTDRSVSHGRYRRSVRLHTLENTVDIDGRFDYT